MCYLNNTFIFCWNGLGKSKVGHPSGPSYKLAIYIYKVGPASYKMVYKHH